VVTCTCKACNQALPSAEASFAAMVERAAAALYADRHHVAPFLPVLGLGDGAWPRNPDSADWWRVKARKALEAALDPHGLHAREREG
jgi:hypothetical protein